MRRSSPLVDAGDETPGEVRERSSTVRDQSVTNAPELDASNFLRGSARTNGEANWRVGDDWRKLYPLNRSNEPDDDAPRAHHETAVLEKEGSALSAGGGSAAPGAKRSGHALIRGGSVPPVQGVGA